MKKLGELKAVVESLEGDGRFISRITSIGLTPGCRFSVVKNDSKRPISWSFLHITSQSGAHYLDMYLAEPKILSREYSA